MYIILYIYIFVCSIFEALSNANPLFAFWQYSASDRSSIFLTRSHDIVVDIISQKDLVFVLYFKAKKMAQGKKGLLERLAEGPILGDGGFCFALEKRGYVKAAVFTPECTVNHPEAGMYGRPGLPICYF